jgi:hypothetical protein
MCLHARSVAGHQDVTAYEDVNELCAGIVLNDLDDLQELIDLASETDIETSPPAPPPPIDDSLLAVSSADANTETTPPPMQTQKPPAASIPLTEDGIPDFDFLEFDISITTEWKNILFFYSLANSTRNVFETRLNTFV